MQSGNNFFTRKCNSVRIALIVVGFIKSVYLHVYVTSIYCTRSLDVSDQDSVKATFQWIEEKFGHMHILINNAGIATNTKILDQGDDVARKINEVINTNVTGLVQCTREAFRLIKKSEDYGFIININSVLGHYIPFMQLSLNIYPPTKYAVTAVTEVLRQELINLKNDKIRVSVSY